VNERMTFAERFKADVVGHLVAFYAILGGVLFFVIQTRRLFVPTATETAMVDRPFGLLEWGFVWSDTVVPGPALLAGGILLLSRGLGAVRFGRMVVFAGFAINLYAMVFLWIGLAAVGEPMAGGELWFNIVATVLGVLCMLHVALRAIREPGPASA
jgi:hypothetical protein